MTEEPDGERTLLSSDQGSESLIQAVRCPRCAAGIDVLAHSVICSRCGQHYPRMGEIPVLLPDPTSYLASCRRQLSLLARHVDETAHAIQEELKTVGVLPLTRTRCLAMVDAIRSQVADVRAIIEPLLPATTAPAVTTSQGSGAFPANMESLPYLYRDWGWDPDPDGENERALSAVETVLGGKPLGRTLILGAGACRLAYDLHRRCPDAEIVVMDIDPVLFGAAHAVMHGEPVSISEANLEIGELAEASREWVLTAPDGPIADDRFHFLLADGREPPMAPGALDTVVTPWFIDQVPADLRDFIGVLHRLLKPGGVWLNLGPLRYEPDVPIPLRFSRDEVFDLATRSGFRLGRWETYSAPYLVSKLNGRGKVEWVLAFAATKRDPSESGEPSGAGPPAWLIFGHLPIPAVAGPSIASQNPFVQMVMSGIDGRRTLEDIALLVARQARRPEVSMSEVRTLVRQCLAEAHPGCRDRS